MGAKFRWTVTSALAITLLGPVLLMTAVITVHFPATLCELVL